MLQITLKIEINIIVPPPLHSSISWVSPRISPRCLHQRPHLVWPHVFKRNGKELLLVPSPPASPPELHQGIATRRVIHDWLIISHLQVTFAAAAAAAQNYAVDVQRGRLAVLVALEDSYLCYAGRSSREVNAHVGRRFCRRTLPTLTPGP